MNPTKRERLVFLASIPDKLLGIVNHQRERNLQDEMWKLCVQNQQLLHCSSATFLFQGEWYTAGHSVKPADKPNREIHPDLRPTIDALINNDNDFDTIVENQKLRNLFGQLSILANHIDDYYAILPPQFGAILSKFNTELLKLNKIVY